MRCPICKGVLKTTDTIQSDNTTHRRKKCSECGHIVYTKENFITKDSPGRAEAWLNKYDKKLRRSNGSKST